jgi:DNA-binding winged helix-turn-helix (wHTH) protein
MSLLFGDFEFDQDRRQLLRSGEPVPLEPKAHELLSRLLERRPRALSRAQIRDVIWPQSFITESTLAVVVNGIRQALSDDARHPRFIRTVHGFGYAFCTSVALDPADDEVLTTLRSWTNLRAVKDPQSPTGWRLEPGPFLGWEKLPQR